MIYLFDLHLSIMLRDVAKDPQVAILTDLNIFCILRVWMYQLKLSI